MEEKSEEEKDASPPALFYLFQEVSKIAFSAQNGFPDTDPPSKWRGEISRKDPAVVKKEEKEAPLLKAPNGSCPPNVSHKFPCGLVNGEGPSNKVQPSVGLQCETNSPWKVLSLINLHCQRLLHQKQEEFDPRSESALENAGHGGERQRCVEESQEGCCQLQAAEERHAVGEEFEDNRSAFLQASHAPEREINSRVNSQLEWNQERTKGHFLAEHVPSGASFSGLTSPQESISCTCSHTQTASSVNGDAHGAPQKPSVKLDHNANILFSGPPDDTRLIPANSVMSVSRPATPQFNVPESYHSISSQHDKTIAECALVPTEEKHSGPAARQKEFASLPSPSSQPETSTEQPEELGRASNCEWKTKKPRKQAHPCRSADSDDPDFQGVTFRMDTELDDTREQCRLLITSKYSKLCKRTRKQRQRTQTPQRPLRTSSSEEEIDLTANILKDKACASCCTRKTPMWRDAEDGTPLCNACGIRYKKYRVRCVNCWHIPRKEGNSNSSCLKCGNFVRLTSAQRKHTT